MQTPDPAPRPTSTRSTRWLKKVARTVLIGLALAVSLFGLVMLTAARPGDPGLHPPAADGEAIEVRIVRNWLHANIAVPRRALADASSGPAASAVANLPDGDWVTIGWGEADHYRGRGDSPARRVSLARSLLVPGNPAVIMMEVTPEAPSPETTGREVLLLRLSRDGFSRLIRRMDRSFALDVQGDPRLAGRGRHPDSLFFRSRETADLFFACNHWIAELLDAAGAPTNPFLSTITLGLVGDLKARAGGRDAPGEPGDERDPGLETPPAHAGRFEPLSAAARRRGTVRFDAYDIDMDGRRIATRPLGLASAASPAGASGSDWAELMRAPSDSLVERRAVLSHNTLCGDRAATELIVGFRVSGSERYELVLAPLAGDRPCEVLHYRQP